MISHYRHSKHSNRQSISNWKGGQFYSCCSSPRWNASSRVSLQLQQKFKKTEKTSGFIRIPFLCGDETKYKVGIFVDFRIMKPWSKATNQTQYPTNKGNKPATIFCWSRKCEHWWKTSQKKYWWIRKRLATPRSCFGSSAVSNLLRNLKLWQKRKWTMLMLAAFPFECETFWENEMDYVNLGEWIISPLVLMADLIERTIKNYGHEAICSCTPQFRLK